MHGVAHFGLGAVSSGLVSLADSQDAMAMCIAIATTGTLTCACAAYLLYCTMIRPSGDETALGHAQTIQEEL